MVVGLANEARGLRESAGRMMYVGSEWQGESRRERKKECYRVERYLFTLELVLIKKRQRLWLASRS